MAVTQRDARRARQLAALPRSPDRERLGRLTDVCGATVMLLVCWPLLLAGMLLVLLTSGRPIFFGHLRVGQGGRRFLCWKLRTMARGAELRLLQDDDLRRRHAARGYKLPVREDPRVTPVGRWLRRSYVDELPQLFNVLNGSMSLLGPRPIVEQELEQYGDSASELLAARPGLFGEWTSRGRARPAYPERARLELEYVRGRSLARDLRILLRSLPAVLHGQEE